MTHRSIVSLRNGLAALSILPMLASPAIAADSLIPRSVLFASPGYWDLSLSPDGRQIAYLRPVDGVPNIWVAPVDDLKAGVPVTAFTTRPPDSFRWSADGRFILVSKDVGGEEHSQLWAVNLASRAVTNLTDNPDVLTKIIRISKKHPGQVLVGMNIRDPRYHDVYLVDLATGKRTEIFRNEARYIDFIADPDLRLRVAVRGNADGSSTYFRLGDAAPAELMTIPLAALRNSKIVSLDAGGVLEMLDSRGSDKAALVSMDLATGTVTPRAAARETDIVEALHDPVTGALLATREDPLVGKWTVRSPDVAAEFQALGQALHGPFRIVGQMPDGKRWLVLETVADQPERYLWWDRQARTATLLVSTRPELAAQKLARRIPVTIDSRDGLKLPSYLTLPRAISVDGKGMPARPVPLVLLVHGGPWLRDDMNLDQQHQWLADRGYAVLSVNFRGSAGFGKAFMSAGDRQWSETMHNDLLDAVQWAIDKGVTSPGTVAAFGLSYGGYSSLVSLSFTPDRFQCAVDMAGPGNLKRLLSEMPAWWTWQRPQFVNRVGNPDDPAGVADLMRRSPLSRVKDIRRPLLVTVGANDPRVPPIQSQEMVDAMNALNKPVTYAFYPDEGHVYAKDRTNISFAAVAEHFLANCLGGRAEPFGHDLEQSGMDLKSGAQFVPGLVEALRAAGDRIKTSTK